MRNFRYILTTAILILIMMRFTGCGDKVSADNIPEYIANEDYQSVVNVYNKCVNGNTAEEEKYNTIIKTLISDTCLAWGSEEMPYDQAINILETLLGIENIDISGEARESADRLTIEYNGSRLECEAEELFSKGSYEMAYKNLSEIDAAYSDYENVETFCQECADILVAETLCATSEEEYDDYIENLKRYIEIKPAPAFAERVEELVAERDDFIASINTINEAKQLFEKNEYIQAIDILTKALKSDEDNDFYSDALKELGDTYVIIVTKKVSGYVEDKEYKEALNLIRDAEEAYPCEALDDLEQYVKEERNPLRKIGNSIVEKIKATSSKWKSENYSVKQAGRDVGAYIVASGKKLVLGDYSKENITVLSFAGETALSFVGLDLPLDLRDISYDFVNWGDEDYFAIRLAVDVVALVPVIGCVKHLDKLKHVPDAIDNVSTVLKNGTDAAKTVDKLVESAVDVSKNSDEAAIVTKTLLRHREKIVTRNQDLVGKLHPKTGVKYLERKLNYSDGRKIVGVFPEFDSKIDLNLPKSLYKADFDQQKKWLTEELTQQTKKGRIRKIFTEDELEYIDQGLMPPGYVWHHNEKEGLMQLVDAEIHEKTAHTGGMSLWGKGY